MEAILAYSQALSSAWLPVVLAAPAWYEEFTARYPQIAVNALAWQNSLLPRRIAIPRTIADYGESFDLKISMLERYADLAARQALGDTLTLLSEEIDRRQRLVDAFAADLSAFGLTLRDDAAVLAQCVADAVQEIGRRQARTQPENRRRGHRTQQVESLDRSLPALQAVRDHVNDLLRLNGEAQAGIGQLLTAWWPMQHKIQGVAGALRSARRRFEASQLLILRADFFAAEKTWEELRAVAAELNRSYGRL